MAASSTSTNRVVVVGSANYDLFAYMSKFPQIGETIHGTRSASCCGGKGSNQCIMSARLGAPTSMIAKVGRDTFGATIKASFEQDGVDTSHLLEAEEGTATGTAQIWVDNDGNNSIVIIAGANGVLRPEDVRNAEKDLIASAAVLVCQLEVPESTTLEALRLAKKHKVRSIFNPAPAKQGLDLEFLRLATIVCPNETELGLLTELPIESIEQIRTAAQKLLEMARQDDDKDAKKVILVTLGGKGALLVSNDNEEGILIPCPRVPRVVDTSGAGDCFIGSLAAYLSRNIPLEEAVQRACTVASISVQRPGTQISYPYTQDLPAELQLT